MVEDHEYCKFNFDNQSHGLNHNDERLFLSNVERSSVCLSVGIRVAERRSGEKEERARVNSAAVGGVGHGHGVETPARG
jgi:hypothetical protein